VGGPKVTIYSLLRLMRLENERLMKCGFEHMNEAEIRFILSGVYGASAQKDLDQIIEEIKRGRRTC